MKKVILLNIILSLSILSIGQVPESFNYQAIPRNSSGGTYPDQAMKGQFSILAGSSAGASVYVETFTASTSSLGILNLQVGKGTPVSGNFTTIGWGSNSYFLKVEIDVTGGTSYVEMGTTQLLSVPYALYSKNAQMAAEKTYVDALLARIELLEILNLGFNDPRDGNHYNIVKIGNQIWMAENLKYLPTVHSNSEFQIQGSNSQPGYGVYGYDGSIVATAKTQPNYLTFGVLYNWYAVKDANLCPIGWHIPTDDEWTSLTTYLGGVSVAGGKLKETGAFQWASPNTGATNETHFTARPSGYRNILDGMFTMLGQNCFWWCVTDFDSDNGLWYGVSSFNSGLGWDIFNKGTGFSVRCLKDH